MPLSRPVIFSFNPRLLSWWRLWLQPETRVMVMGSGWDVDALLTDKVFRNTRQAMYIAPYISSHGSVCSYDCKTDLK